MVVSSILMKAQKSNTRTGLNIVIRKSRKVREDSGGQWVRATIMEEVSVIHKKNVKQHN